MTRSKVTCDNLSCNKCINVIVFVNRLHYGFDKFLSFCFHHNKTACIIYIIEFSYFFPVPFFLILN